MYDVFSIISDSKNFNLATKKFSTFFTVKSYAKYKAKSLGTPRTVEQLHGLDQRPRRESEEPKMALRSDSELCRGRTTEQEM